MSAIPDPWSPAVIRDSTSDLTRLPQENLPGLPGRGLTLAFGKMRGDGPLFSLTYFHREGTGGLADGPAEAARQTVARVAAAAAAEARKQAAAAEEQARAATEAAAREEAEAGQAADAAGVELAKVRAELNVLRRTRQAELAAGRNPSDMEEALHVAERKARTTEEWAEGLQAKHRDAVAALAKASVVQGVDARRHWRGKADVELSKLADRRSALRARAAEVIQELQDELLEIHLSEALLRGDPPRQLG